MPNVTAIELTNDEMHKRLKEIIRQKSFATGTKITLASGKTSNHYFNMKPTMLDPEGAFLIARLMLEKLGELDGPFDALGGLELGAVPIASAIAPLSHLCGHPIQAFIIRKQAKDHGTESLVEGLMREETLSGKQIIIVEDVTTTGNSALKAIAAARRDGAVVNYVLTILDRGEGAAENFQNDGIELISLFKASDFLAND